MSRWTLLQTARNVMSGWMALLTGPPLPGKGQLALDFLRLRIKVWKYGRTPWDWTEDRLLGMRLLFPDGPSFTFLVEEVFMRQCYGRSSVLDGPAPSQVVDCGANIGLASLYFLHRFGPQRLTVIEPNPGAHRYLEANLAETGAQGVRIHRVAAGEPGTTLNVPAAALTDASPGTRLRPEAAHGEESGGATVDVLPLSALFKGVAELVKVDVEGGEEAIIRELLEAGAFSRIQTLVLEVHPHLIGEEGVRRVLWMLGEGGMRVESGPDELGIVVARGEEVRSK